MDKGVIAYTTKRVGHRKGMRIYLREVNNKKIEQLKKMVVRLKISKPLQALITDTSKIEAVMFTKRIADTWSLTEWFLIKKASQNVSNRLRDEKGQFVKEA